MEVAISILKKIYSLLIIFIFVTPAITFATNNPVIFFSDLTSGPKTGWEGSTTKGAAVTIWGEGFGNQGYDSVNNYVSVGGVKITEYAEWGEDLGPARKLDRISFWLHSGVPDGSTTITVTVNGKTSNAIPFTVRQGNIYFISTTGSDSNNGEYATNRGNGDGPFLTISHAKSKMSPGDIAYMRGGNYTDGEIWIRREYGDSGEAGRPKVIRNYPAEVVNLTNANRPFIIEADYITVSGLNFLNGKSISVRKLDGTNVRIVGNVIKGKIGYDAIGTHGDNIDILGNVVEAEGSSMGTQGHCIYVSHGQNIRIMYNVLKGATGYDLHIFDQNRVPSDPQSDIQRIIKNVIVEGNILMGSPYQQRSGMIIAMQDEGHLGNYIENVTIKNNIFYKNNHKGINIGGIAKNVKVYNNVFYENGRGGIYINGGGSLTDVVISNNIFYHTNNDACNFSCSWFRDVDIEVDDQNVKNLTINNNLYYLGVDIYNGNDTSPKTGNPLFVDPSNLDFHLQANSSAIDAGVDLTEITTDFDGNPRPMDGNNDGVAKPDLGAFEYTGTYLPPQKDTIPPAPPQNLKATFIPTSK